MTRPSGATLIERLSRYHVIGWLLRQSNKRCALCVTFSFPWRSVLVCDSTVTQLPICWLATCIFKVPCEDIKVFLYNLLFCVLFFSFTCYFYLKQSGSFPFMLWIATTWWLYWISTLSCCELQYFGTFSLSKKAIYKGQFLTTSCYIHLHHFFIYNISFRSNPDPVKRILKWTPVFFSFFVCLHGNNLEDIVLLSCNKIIASHLPLWLKEV